MSQSQSQSDSLEFQKIVLFCGGLLLASFRLAVEEKFFWWVLTRLVGWLAVIGISWCACSAIFSMCANEPDVWIPFWSLCAFWLVVHGLGSKGYHTK